MGRLLLDPSKETHSKDHGKQLGKGGGRKGQKQNREPQESAASSRRSAKPSLALGPLLSLPPAQQSVTQRRGPSSPPRGASCGKTFFFFFPLKAIPPLLPLPTPKPFVVTAASLASFSNHPRCRKGAGPAVPALHIIATAWDGNSLAFVGAAGAPCPDPSPLHKDRGKHPALPQRCCWDIGSGLMSHLLEACSWETSPKSRY